MRKQAVLSEDGKYRYQLSRSWDETKLRVLFIMLNPSTADSSNDDPTIRRCIGFAKSWGYGEMMVGNLFAYRATNPKDLLATENPIGEYNLENLKAMYGKCKTVVCAWGNQGIIDKLAKKHPNYQPLSFVHGELFYLELSKTGTPKHPLYLKKELTPKSFSS